MRALLRNVNLRHSEEWNDEESRREEILRSAQNDGKMLFRNSPQMVIRRAAGSIGALLVVIGLLQGFSPYNFELVVFIYGAALIFAIEGLTRLLSGHSVLGTSARYYLAPQYYFEGWSAFLGYFFAKSIFFFTSIRGNGK